MDAHSFLFFRWRKESNWNKLKRTSFSFVSDKIETAAETSQIWSFRTVVARVAAAVRPLPAHVQALVKRFQAMQR